MSVFSQLTFTPLTRTPVIHPAPDIPLTREQTLSPNSNSVHLLDHQLHSLGEHEHERGSNDIPIGNVDVGTSSKPLNDLITDIQLYGESVTVHRVCFIIIRFMIHRSKN